MAGFWEKSFIGMHTNIYRWSGGRIGGVIGGTPVLLLTTTGRKTARERTTPLGYFLDGRGLHRVSNGGRPQRPAWYLNLSQNPQVTIRIKEQVRPAVAAPVSAEQRAELWSRIVAAAPRICALFNTQLRGIRLYACARQRDISLYKEEQCSKISLCSGDARIGGTPAAPGAVGRPQPLP